MAFKVLSLLLRTHMYFVTFSYKSKNLAAVVPKYPSKSHFALVTELRS